MFKPFFPADPVRRQAVLGVNVGIVKEIVYSKGGRIEIANRPEGGTDMTRRREKKPRLICYD